MNLLKLRQRKKKKPLKLISLQPENPTNRAMAPRPIVAARLSKNWCPLTAPPMATPGLNVYFQTTAIAPKIFNVKQLRKVLATSVGPAYPVSQFKNHDCLALVNFEHARSQRGAHGVYNGYRHDEYHEQGCQIGKVE